MAINNARGSALVEGLPVMMLLVVFVSGLMLASYLLFSRAWIQYQSEQALYCLAERQIGCPRLLQEHLRRFLPWGESVSHVYGSRQHWVVEVQWRYGDILFRQNKELTPTLILKNRGLLW